jgi:hypothetical protein
MGSEPRTQNGPPAAEEPPAWYQALARQSERGLAADDHRRSAMRRHVAEVAVLERHLEDTLGRRVEQITAPGPAAAAVRRFHAMIRGQREALDARLEHLGGLPEGQAAPPPTAPTAAPHGSHAGGPHAVTAALRDDYAAFCRAAIGYTTLHHTARVFFDTTTAEVAEGHLRGHAAAAQEVQRLLPEVVAWAFRQEGQRCLCRCPGCAMGVCLCVASTVTATDQAWREATPAPQERGVLVVRTASCPAALGLEDGDRLTAVDGQELGAWPDAIAAILRRASGEPVRLLVERGGTAVQVTATCP